MSKDLYELQLERINKRAERARELVNELRPTLNDVEQVEGEVPDDIATCIKIDLAECSSRRVVLKAFTGMEHTPDYIIEKVHSLLRAESYMPNSPPSEDAKGHIWYRYFRESLRSHPISVEIVPSPRRDARCHVVEVEAGARYRAMCDGDPVIPPKD